VGSSSRCGQRQAPRQYCTGSPAASQSDLVGLNVVLSTFKGKVIEEIDKTSGGQ